MWILCGLCASRRLLAPISVCFVAYQPQEVGNSGDMRLVQAQPEVLEFRLPTQHTKFEGFDPRGRGSPLALMILLRKK